MTVWLTSCHETVLLVQKLCIFLQVLADMDDSMVAVLPPDLATEANMLRRELEDRHRRIMQERLFNQGSDPLSALMRHTGVNLCLSIN